MTANNDKSVQERTANAGLASLLNLTVLPGIAFIWLLMIYQKTRQQSTPEAIDSYHARLGIKLNLIAAAALFLVSALMILLGGFHSPWTWVYVISYFTMVHTIFIVFAIWALVRAWSGERLKKTTPA
jgi:threonine/homoserine/homoserine lactone efflux protein